MDQDHIKEMYKMVDYLSEAGKEEWVDLLHGIIIYIEEAEEVSSESSDSETDEYGSIPEGVPEVNIDSNGFQSLV
tara:strand:- start:1606 stop:1830 length:225 start_codon:yes stop_codon:yes gene_type:complete